MMYATDIEGDELYFRFGYDFSKNFKSLKNIALGWALRSTFKEEYLNKENWEGSIFWYRMNQDDVDKLEDRILYYFEKLGKQRRALHQFEREKAAKAIIFKKKKQFNESMKNPAFRRRVYYGRMLKAVEKWNHDHKDFPTHNHCFLRMKPIKLPRPDPSLSPVF